MESGFNTFTTEEFQSTFTDDNQCLKYLSERKWNGGYVCKKCGNKNYCKGKTPYSRRCTRCKSEESATANTIFHRCKVPLTDAFKIAFMVCSNPDISTYELARQIDIRQMTCWKLKKKIMDCIAHKGNLDVLNKPK